MMAQPVRESFVMFTVGSDACVGVLAMPEIPAKVGVAIVVGGPQYRVGSHRQFTRLARDLAGAGFATLRFDYRGMGDSEGEPRTFESVDDDIRAAVDALQRETGLSSIVLWGLCDGASAALMFAASDARVAGVVAVNPWARTEATVATTRLRHYYAARLAAPDFWRKLVRGRFDWRTSARDLSSAVRNVAAPGQRAAPFQERMHRGWRALRVPVLFVLSERDFTAREFEAWVHGDDERRALLASATVMAVAAADHTFSGAEPRGAMTRATLDWTAHLCETS